MEMHIENIHQFAFNCSNCEQIMLNNSMSIHKIHVYEEKQMGIHMVNIHNQLEKQTNTN